MLFTLKVEAIFQHYIKIYRYINILVSMRCVYVHVGSCQPAVRIVCLVALLRWLELYTQDGETDLRDRKPPLIPLPVHEDGEPLDKEDVRRLFVAFLQLLYLL